MTNLSFKAAGTDVLAASADFFLAPLVTISPSDLNLSTKESVSLDFPPSFMARPVPLKYQPLIDISPNVNAWDSHLVGAVLGFVGSGAMMVVEPISILEEL